MPTTKNGTLPSSSRHFFATWVGRNFDVSARAVNRKDTGGNAYNTAHRRENHRDHHHHNHHNIPDKQQTITTLTTAGDTTTETPTLKVAQIIMRTGGTSTLAIGCTYIRRRRGRSTSTPCKKQLGFGCSCSQEEHPNPRYQDSATPVRALQGMKGNERPAYNADHKKLS